MIVSHAVNVGPRRRPSAHPPAAGRCRTYANPSHRLGSCAVPQRRWHLGPAAALSGRVTLSGRSPAPLPAQAPDPASRSSRPRTRERLALRPALAASPRPRGTSSSALRASRGRGLQGHERERDGLTRACRLSAQAPLDGNGLRVGPIQGVDGGCLGGIGNSDLDDTEIISFPWQAASTAMWVFDGEVGGTGTFVSAFGGYCLSACAPI